VIWDRELTCSSRRLNRPVSTTFVFRVKGTKTVLERLITWFSWMVLTEQLPEPHLLTNLFAAKDSSTRGFNQLSVFRCVKAPDCENNPKYVYELRLFFVGSGVIHSVQLIWTVRFFFLASSFFWTEVYQPQTETNTETENQADRGLRLKRCRNLSVSLVKTAVLNVGSCLVLSCVLVSRCAQGPIYQEKIIVMNK